MLSPRSSFVRNLRRVMPVVVGLNIFFIAVNLSYGVSHHIQASFLIVGAGLGILVSAFTWVVYERESRRQPTHEAEDMTGVVEFPAWLAVAILLLLLSVVVLIILVGRAH